MKKFPRASRVTAVLAVVVAGAAQAQYAKLDGPLSDLVDSLKPRKPSVSRTDAAAPRSNVLSRGVRDAGGGVLVDIYLDGSLSMADFLAQLQSVGATVTGVNPDFRFGAVSAYVPTSAIPSVAVFGGLQQMKMTLAPQNNVGVTTSQGAKVMRSDVANAGGYVGTGITVGVLSNSYDASPTSFTTIRAANDIASGDLKAPKLLIEAPTPTGTNTLTDEGRAMMQIVLDVAPGADLCFATAVGGQAAFAANIRTLRTNPACAADVIVDDAFYYDEPYFSDGQVAQAVTDVVTSTTLAGKKVSYFSSAGNQGAAGGYGSIDLPNATFTTAPTGLGNINLATAATCTSSPSTGSTKANVAGGWLTYADGTNAVAVTYNSGGSTLALQWDDPFYQGLATTDLNFYLFNSAGSCVFAFASNNLPGGTDNGIEFVGLSGGASGTFRIMVGRTGAGSNQATRVRMASFGGFTGAAFTQSSPTTFGHSAVAAANSVAAYRYTSPATQQSPFLPTLELFSSPGPVTIVFDSANNRLAVPETRKKPDIAAPDGGNTTFFYPGSDFEGDGRPNFFGTSAAAPHAAAVAALLLQKAGGPNSLTPKQVKSLLQTTTPARVIPFSGGAPVKTWSIYDGYGLIDAVNALSKLP